MSRELVGGELVHACLGHDENEYNEGRSKSVKAVKKGSSSSRVVSSKEDAMVGVKKRRTGRRRKRARGEGEELKREKNKDFGVDGVAAGFWSQRGKWQQRRGTVPT